MSGAFCSLGNVLDTLAAALDLVDRLVQDPVEFLEELVPSPGALCHHTLPQDCPL